MKTCPSCGTQHSDDQTVCNADGNAPSPNGSQVPPATQSPRRIRKPASSLLVHLAFALVLVIFARALLATPLAAYYRNQSTVYQQKNPQFFGEGRNAMLVVSDETHKRQIFLTDGAGGIAEAPEGFMCTMSGNIYRQTAKGVQQLTGLDSWRLHQSTPSLAAVGILFAAVIVRWRRGRPEGPSSPPQ